MSRIDDLIAEHCPTGVELRPSAKLENWSEATAPEGRLRERVLGSIHYGQIYTEYGTSATTRASPSSAGTRAAACACANR